MVPPIKCAPSKGTNVFIIVSLLDLCLALRDWSIFVILYSTMGNNSWYIRSLFLYVYSIKTIND